MQNYIASPHHYIQALNLYNIVFSASSTISL